MKSSGDGSPNIFSTGTITARDFTGTAMGSEAVVIEGKNNVELTDSRLRGEKLCGVMIYQSFSGDADVGIAKFSMKGGSLEAAAGPLFYINNTTAEIHLAGVRLSAASGILVKAAAGRWGVPGRNGGRLTLTADGQILNGDVEVDNISTVSVIIKSRSTLNGSINAANTAGAAHLTLDASSTWNVTADSCLTSLTLSDGIPGANIDNIVGNGYTVYYERNANNALEGRIYGLKGGGRLTPR